MAQQEARTDRQSDGLPHLTGECDMALKQALRIPACGFDELREYFLTLEAPYTLHDIYGFNAIYKLAYPGLSREERLLSEEFVEILIEKVEKPEWVSRIFGVV
jgi:hypothetical protein